jgi:serine/threonine protein kinase/TolA-binding protein
MTLPASTTSAHGDHDGVLADLLDDLANRLRAGQAADVEELALAYPEHAEPLRRLAPAVRLLAEVDRSEASGDAPDRDPGPATGLSALGDFRILGELGRGGMGVVYAAEQVSLGRRVALKVLPLAATLDPRRLQRFQNEARAAGCLHHTNIVPVYAVGVAHGVHFYAMQLIEGQTLAAVIRDLCRHDKHRPATPEGDTGRRDADTAALPTGLSAEAGARNRQYVLAMTRLAKQAADALDYAHQLGVVHRDIKPGNLMVDDRGQLWVTDFGLAQFSHGETGLTLTGDMVGTLRYMSPEQALGQHTVIDHRADVYALGATLYEMLTLEPALDGQDRQELLRQIAFEDPRPPRQLNPTIPADLETIVLKAMAKHPAERYATAQELAQDLHCFLEDKAIRARRPSRLERTRKWARRHRSVMWSGTIALLATLAVLAGSLGWIVRDQAARDAKVQDDLQTALDEAHRYQREGKGPQAQAAALRAKAILNYGAVDPAVAIRVFELLRILAQEAADRRVLARIEHIRRLQAEVDTRENRYAIEKALPEYHDAFHEYGWEANVLTPAQVAAQLTHRPTTMHATLLAALDHWLILARHMKAPEAPWLEQVLAQADTDDWRQRVRAARKNGDRAALEQLAREVDAAAQAPEALFMLDMSLRQRGAFTTAVALLRRAQAAFPGDFWINHDLGMALQEAQPPEFDEALRFLTVAVALRPDNAGARNNLALALFKKGRYAEAAVEYRAALKHKPDYAVAQSNLALILWEQGCFDEAIEAYRKAASLQPDIVCVHRSLGDALWKRGQLGEAQTAYRKAIALRADYAEAHCNLGLVLLQQGAFTDAHAALQRGHELGTRLPYWAFPSGNWLKECERMIALDRQWPDAFDIDAPPASALERVEIAQLCQYKQRYAAAARWWSSAFAADPKLAGNLTAGNRYSAARAATMAAAGLGEDAAVLDEQERVGWQRQALKWLQADLAAHGEQVRRGNVGERQLVRRRLRSWQSYPDLATVRDPAALAQLASADQATWRQLWADTAALVDRAGAT